MKTKKSFRYSLNVFILPFLFTFVLLFLVIWRKTSQDIRSRAANTGASLSLIPSTITGKVGTIQPVFIELNTNGDTVSAVELHISYNASHVEVSNFIPGSNLPSILKTYLDN